ncbi:MAG: hypothetical protein H8F28_14625 [Fibrella sp.]|nr:hypothetical protein [Armatimonadota bacterium]
MANKQVLFPHASRGFARAASDEPVLLNGMRVLFDDKVALYPVELEPDPSREKPEKTDGKKRDDSR